jgi:hypothetical protein
MTSESPESPDHTLPEIGWLQAPDVPSGARLHISTVIEAEHVTPHVLEVLSKAMLALEDSAKTRDVISSDSCKRLRSCGTFRGGCPNLTSCGTYAPPGTPTI